MHKLCCKIIQETVYSHQANKWKPLLFILFVCNEKFNALGASSGETYHLKYTCANKQFWIYQNSPTHLLLLFVISYSYRRFLICVFMNITIRGAIFDVQHFRWAITINRWLLLNAVQNGITPYYFIATLTKFGRKLHQFKW